MDGHGDRRRCGDARLSALSARPSARAWSGGARRADSRHGFFPLQSRGVFPFQSGARARRNLLASRHYDAAVVDVEMPVRGADLADETRRAEEPNAHTRFIGMTAGDPAAAIRAKFDTYLRKPIDHASLRHALLGPGTGAPPSQPGLWIDG
jgi:CheY-like chemotaxis protein